jgi:hypothetical protein
LEIETPKFSQLMPVLARQAEIGRRQVYSSLLLPEGSQRLLGIGGAQHSRSGGLQRFTSHFPHEPPIFHPENCFTRLAHPESAAGRPRKRLQSNQRQAGLGEGRTTVR